MRKLNIYWTAMTIFVLSFTSVAEANQTRQKIQTGIRLILEMPELPLVKDPDRRVTLHQDPLSSVTINVFNRIQKSLFGATGAPFSLKAYWGAAAACDVEGRIVYMNPRFEESLRSIVPANEIESVIALIIGHEIGHYFYEAHVAQTSNHLSPLGNPYYIGNGQISEEQSNRAHGEVDLFGIYIAERAGFDPSLASKMVGYTDQAIRKMTRNFISLTREEIDARTALIETFLERNEK
jgi:hypothetical protein